MDKKIIIIAGEPSGDLHGCHLIKNLKRYSKDIKISGLGGRLMREAGAEIYYDLTDIAVVGFFEILKNLHKFRKVFKFLLKKIDQIRPDVIILIDYPGFNLKIAKEIKKRNIPIIYYISPQVWAWNKKRIGTIKKLVDKMIVVFKFEKELYKQEKIDAYFSGHPLIDIVKATQSKDDVLTGCGLDSAKKIITLMPGSRENEVQRNLPVMLDAASLVKKTLKDVQFVVIRSSSLKKEIFDENFKNKDINPELVPDNTYNILNVSSFAIICSGTATLESAILNIPLVIVYKISFLSWLFIKQMIKIPYIGLVNIVAGKQIVPEFIQYNARPEKIAEFITDCLTNEEKTEKIKENLKKVKQSLGEPGASKRAARYIIDFLQSR